MAPSKSDSVSHSSSDSEAAAAALQTSARSSSVSLKALKRQLTEQLSHRNLTLTPTLTTDLAFTRNQIRNAYLRLLFHAPFTKSAQHAELGLWNDTTHKLVAMYRGRLAKLEKEMRDPMQRQSSTSRPTTPSKEESKAGTPHGSANSAAKRKAQTQEYSKLAEALRQFLAKEEAFWRGLAERMATVFKLSDAHHALERAGITFEGQKIPTGPKAIVGEGGRPAGLARLPTSPAELDQTVLQMASLPRHKERLIHILQRILVYCGDLARYREIQRDNFASSPSRKGPGHRAASKKTSTLVASPILQQRNFEDAVACYEAARMLVPSHGNSSNQLALVSGCAGDTFGAIYHYYRALCVKVPFESAKYNLETSLVKAVSEWAKDGGVEALDETDSSSARVQSDGKRKQACLMTFVVLQGLFYTCKSFTSLQTLSSRFHQSFQDAVADRILPTDAIVRILVTSIAASWTARLWRKSESNDSLNKQMLEVQAGEAKKDDRHTLTLNVELQILDHVLANAQALFNVATSQIRVALESALRPPGGPAGKIPAREGHFSTAKNLTPVLRRVLPAMRIASKWIKSHLDYIDRSQQSCISKAAQGFTALKDGSGNTEAVACAAAELALIQRVEDFWASFIVFMNTLRYAFPFDDLPNLGTVRPTGAATLSLEEDTDLRGFIPIRRGMLTQDDKPAKLAHRETHPNEEQLMRIADLLVDAKVIAESEASPIVFDDAKGTFVVDAFAKAGLHNSSRPESHLNAKRKYGNEAEAKTLASTLDDGDDDASIGTSEATDDIIDLAMRARDLPHDLHGADASEDEDAILIPAAVQSQYLQRARPPGEQEKPALGFQNGERSHNPLADLEKALPQQVGTPSTYAAFRSSSTASSSLARPYESVPGPISGGSTTAQDLFLQMLNGRPSIMTGSTDSSGFATPPARELSHPSPAPLSLPRAPSGPGSPSHTSAFSLTPQSHLLFGGLGGGSDRQNDVPNHRSIAGLASIWSPGPGEVKGQHQNSLQSSPGASTVGEGLWGPTTGPATPSGFATPTGFASLSAMQQQQLRQTQQWQAPPSQLGSIEGEKGAWLHQQRG